jgi:hypothetical protein
MTGKDISNIILSMALFSVIVIGIIALVTLAFLYFIVPSNNLLSYFVSVWLGSALVSSIIMKITNRYVPMEYAGKYEHRDASLIVSLLTGPLGLVVAYAQLMRLAGYFKKNDNLTQV